MIGEPRPPSRLEMGSWFFASGVCGCNASWAAAVQRYDGAILFLLLASLLGAAAFYANVKEKKK